MNIPLLYWASEELNDPRYRSVAMFHADTVLRTFFRPDGSCSHIVEFDPVTGQKVRVHGGQGLREDSSWTRGQGWAIYGFAVSARHTGEARYLQAARKTADYFISRIPESGLIPADFEQPEVPAWEDCAAAAIAASGLIELAEQLDEKEGKPYLRQALRLLKTLYVYRCNWSREEDCILENCTAAYHGKEHHIHMIYGDYFFMEAVFRLCQPMVSMW